MLTGSYFKQNLLLVLLFLSGMIYAQTTPKQLYEKGQQLADSSEFEAAISTWRYIIDSTESSGIYYGRSFLKIARTYQKMELTDSARMWYERTIWSELDDTDQAQGADMPYENYKHTACIMLSGVYSNMQNYDMGLAWLDSAQTKYPFRTDNGTSFEKWEVVIASKRSELYEKKSLPEMAVHVLVLKILDSDISYRFPNMEGMPRGDFYSRITEKCLALIDNNFGRDRFKQELTSAIKSMEIEKDGKKRIAVFEVFGNAYKLGTTNKKFDADMFYNRIVSSKFFKSL